MKILIMCEGANEKEIMDILLENDCLIFTEDDLIGLTPYHARQIKTSAQVRMELNIYPGKVKILRVGDKQSDILKIPAEYKDKIISVEKYCTKPELEMLLIIAEGLVSEYEKVKSGVILKVAKTKTRNPRIVTLFPSGSMAFYAEVGEYPVEINLDDKGAAIVLKQIYDNVPIDIRNLPRVHY